MPFECPVSYRSQISATTKDFMLQVSPNAQGSSHTCMGKFMKYCEKARLQSVTTGSSRARLILYQPLHLLLTPPLKHFKCHTAQPFPAPYEKLRQSLNIKKKKKIQKSYGLCCLTTMLAVSMYKLIRVGFSPLPLTVKL